MNLNLPIPSHTLTTLGLFLIKSKRSQSFLALCKTAAFTLWLLLSNLFIQAQDGDYTYEGETLDPVVAEARLKIMFKELTDIDRLIHSVSIGKIAKDTRLVEYAEGFMERNQIEVLTIGYIDSDAIWPRVFKNQRLKKIEKADTDNLLVGKIIFIPVEDGEDITGYTVELQLSGKAVSVYELLDVSKEQLDLIAEETTEEELGSTEYAKPKLAQDAVVNAMILALQRVDEQSNTEPGGNTTQHVAFAAASNQQFGFDGSFKTEFKTDYPSIRVGGKSYRSAWKSLKSNTPDQVIATDPANQDLTFEFNGTPITATSGADDTYSLTLTGQSDEVEGELLVKVGDYLAGQLNTISYDNVEQVVKIVPINGAGGGITQGQLQTKLNEIYGVAIASWNVEVLANQNLGTAWDDEGNGLEVGDNSTLSNYTSEMNDLIRAFKQNNDRDKKAYYVFLVNKAESSTYLGYMPRKKQWGFVFTEGQSTDQLITTIAHELGHGVYRLEHTFSEKGIPKGQTQNLMDYAGGTDLYKYQWDYVHDPESVVTLFDDEEDAAYGAATIFDALFEESDIDVVPTEDSQTELTSGGIILTYKGQQVTFNGFRVSFSLNPGNGELTISQIAPRYSPDDISTINILISRATNRFKELLDARDDYPPFENVAVAELAMEEEAAKIKEFLAQTIETLNQEGDQLEDFIGLPEEEKEKLKAAIADFKDNQNIDSKVTVLDEATFDELKDSFTPEKEVHLLLGKTADGYKKQFYYQDNFFNYPTAKTTASGETISLDYKQSDVETIRDQHIDKSINNPNAIDNLTKKPEPTLNIFERGMWVVKVSKETLAEIKVPVPMWNSEDETDTYPFELNSLTAGLGDGAVDELKSIPDLLVLALSLFDEQERAALLQALEQLDYETVKKMFQEKADKYAGGGDVAFHEAGYDGVQIASMFWGGAFIKGAKKGSETAGEVTDVVKRLSDDILKEFDNASVLEDLSKLSDKTRLKIMKELADDSQLLKYLDDNPVLSKAWTQHKQVVSQADLDLAAELVDQADDAIKDKITNLITDSQKKQAFLELMGAARKYQSEIFDLWESSFLRSASEVSFDVVVDGKTFRTRLDGVGFDNVSATYKVIEAKMGGAVFSEAQSMFMKALKEGTGEIIPVGQKAIDVFQELEGTNVLNVLSKYVHLNDEIVNIATFAGRGL